MKQLLMILVVGFVLGCIGCYQTEIIAPEDGDKMTMEDPISFTGTGVDSLGNPIPYDKLVWVLDDEYSIGFGSIITAMLPEGYHTITLEAPSFLDLSNFDSINIYVYGPKDPDGDTILSDGDNSGVPGDNFCGDGETENCDDNCPNIENPDQENLDNDNLGYPCDSDDDGDGYERGYLPSMDCKDRDPTVFPGAVEIPDDGIDQDCDGYDLITTGRFTDMGDGTIRDTKTGLIWLKDTDALGMATWSNAMIAAAVLDEEDFEWLTDGSSEGDWRLPTIPEWGAFVDTTYSNPALCDTEGTAQWTQGDAFNDVHSEGYWSSTDVHTDAAGSMFMDLGQAAISSKDYNYYIWPVRMDN